MKQTSLGKMGVLVTIISIAVPVIINSSLAQQFLPSPITKDDDFLACVQDAEFRFTDFVSSSIAYDGFVDYWVDIFGKNRCEQMDIENVLRRIKQVRTSIRQSFYACDDDRARTLGNTYNKLLAELYYVRHVTFTDQDNPSGRFAVVNPEIYAEMQTRFVEQKGYFSLEEFNKLYQNLTQKYAKSLDPTREGSYLNCNDPVFDDLKDKWQEFLDTAGGFNTGIAAAERSIEREIKRLERNPAQSYGNLFWGFVDVKVNGLDPLDGLEQIYDETKRDLPFTDVGVSHKQLFEGAQQATQEFTASKSKAEMMAKYEFLYLNTTDSLRDSLEKKLKETNKIIKDTFRPLTDLGECVGTVYSRQCKVSE